jgi:rod shape determining protein RodA
MIFNRNKILSTTDWWLVATILFLVFFGLAAIYSVALGRGTGEFDNFQKQIMWMIFGFIVMFSISFVDYRVWRKISWIGYLILIILLILVLTPLGSTFKGARGWFDLGPASFQPVELTKVFLILVMADICSRYSREIHKLGQLFFMGTIVAIPLILVIIQPDFGSAMVLFFIWLCSFLLILQKRWHGLLVFGGMIILLLAAWMFFLQDYQKDRVKTFLNPELDPLGRGYNVQQSIIAVGAGKLLGRGLGFGSQSQLKFIPESQTDFIFAVIAEEIGFVGVALVIFLFGMFFYRFYGIASRAPDDFGMFVALLTTAMIFVHVFVNAGMCVGLLPVTGISLPFVSYGGSFLLTIMILMGINLSIYRYGAAIKKVDNH